MRRNTLATALMVIAIVGMVVSPVSAEPVDKPAGEQINLIGGGPTTLNAGEAFHIAHGFGIDPAESHAVGQFDFRLDIDGEDQGKGKLLTTGVGYDVDPFAKGEMTRVFLYNFEDGLDTDTYTFTGHWSASCRTAMESFGYPGPCPQENSQVQLLTFSLSVTFK